MPVQILAPLDRDFAFSPGGCAGQTSMRLNDLFRLILKFKTEGERVAVLLEVVDYH